MIGIQGVVLFQYAIGDRKWHTIMKRSTQRSIHLQILLFSASTDIFRQEDGTFMVFGTGQIAEIKLITERRVVQIMLELDGHNTEYYVLL